jgi:hypothetical protein
MPAEVVFDFGAYFQQLSDIGETPTGFDLDKWAANIENSTTMLKSCQPLRYFNTTDCRLQAGNANRVEVKYLVNYRIEREDLGASFSYGWGNIAAAIRNLPLLPYEQESAKINIEIRLAEGEKKRLAFASFTYKTAPCTTPGMGIAFDRDYYPGHNPYDATKGQKVKIAKVWIQTMTKVKTGAKVIVKIPYEI